MDLSRESFTNKKSSSLLYYTPKSQMDYGTVLCVASNVVGRQIVPCIYHVIPAGPPDPPRNCTLTNQTHDSLQVDCQEGFGSGLSQEFHMEVFTDLQLLVNITARSPRLVARGLPPGQVLFLRVYASNSKGRSRSVRIDGYTLRMADKRPVVDGTSKEVSSKETAEETWSSWALVIFLGIALTLLVFAIAIGFLAKMNSTAASQQRRQRDAAAAAAASANRHSAQIAASKLKMETGNGNGYNNDSSLLSQAFHSPQDLQDRSPDVIPHFTTTGGVQNDGNGSTAGQQNTFRRGGPVTAVDPRSPPSVHSGALVPASTGPPNGSGPQQGQIRSSIDMVRVYNYGPQSLQQQPPQTNPIMKDVMFRSAGANGTNGLYSPIANSDSSGFSEQRADLSSYSGSQGGPPGGYTTFNPAFRPVAGTGQGHIYDRSLSPQVPHTYHNPTLMASPYSTLPRRPTSSSSGASSANRGQPQQPHHDLRGCPPPIMASAVGRNSPLLELTGVGGSNNRSSSLGRNTSLFNHIANQDRTSLDKFKQVTRQSALSPQQNNGNTSDDRESCV